MTFGPQIIKTEYPDQYIWAPFGPIPKNPAQKEVKIPLVSQDEITRGSTKAFPFLLPEVTIIGTKPNTVFSQNTNQVNNIGGEKTNVSTDITTNAAVNGTNKKTGESIDERLTRYYTKYKNATKPEEKEAFLDRYITGHYATLKDKSREEQIKIQLADFKKLISNTTNPDSYEMLAKKINVLEKENQVLAAKSATVEQEDLELKKRGEIGVAKTTHNCDKDNQIPLTHIVVDSRNEEAINIGASNASKLDKTKQVEAVDIYKTAQISEEAKIKLGKIIVDQYSQFNVANQLDIHKIMSDTKYWDPKSVTYAESNICNLDKANQTQAAQISANAKAEIETKEKSICVNTNKSELSKTEQIKEAIKSNDPDIIKELSDAQKMHTLQTLSGNDLKNFIKILLEENPSMAVFSKALELVGKLNPEDQKEVMGLIKNSSMANLINEQTLDYSAQNALIDFKAEEGNLDKVNSDKLSAALKAKYFKLIENTKQGKQVG